MSIGIPVGRNNVQVSDVKVQDKTQIRKIAIGRPVRRVAPAGNAIGLLTDVDITDLQNGSLLIYKTETNKWTSSKDIDDGQNVNGGSY